MSRYLGPKSRRIAAALVLVLGASVPSRAAAADDIAATPNNTWDKSQPATNEVRAVNAPSAMPTRPSALVLELQKEKQDPPAEQATQVTATSAERGTATAGTAPAERTGRGPSATPPASPKGPNNQDASRFTSAGELNSRLPTWLRFDAEYQARLEYGFSGKQFAPGSQDGYFLNRIRFGVTLRPVGWLKFHGQAQDARAFEKRPPHTPGFYDMLDVRQAYMEVGDTEGGAAAIRAGRQIFYWGEGRLVADSRWSFPGRSFDAVRLTLRHNGYRVDGFAASVVQIRSLYSPGFSEWHFGNDIYGVYGGIEKLVPKAVIEPYVFWRVGTPIAADTQGLSHRDFRAYRFRWNGKLPRGFDYATEIAVERGKVADSDLSAWAGHWLLGHTWNSTWKPRFFAEYNYATGDGSPTDNKVQTFDVIYPSSHLKWGETDQVGWRNIHDVRGSVEVAPSKSWAVSGNYHAYWLANTHDALYSANGTVVIPTVPAGTAGRWVGQELDVQSSHKFAAIGLEVGAGVGHIFPGTFIKRASPGHGYTYPYVMMTYTF